MKSREKRRYREKTTQSRSKCSSEDRCQSLCEVTGCCCIILVKWMSRLSQESERGLWWWRGGKVPESEGDSKVRLRET
jgi:hypothetical protein